MHGTTQSSMASISTLFPRLRFQPLHMAGLIELILSLPRGCGERHDYFDATAASNNVFRGTDKKYT